MKLSFRWYGADDKVTLENIRQIPKMEAIVTAVYDVPVGEVWSEKSIADLKKQVEENGLKTVNDEGELRKTIDDVIAANPQSVEDYHNGKEKAIGFLVGQTMKAMHGKADPGMVNKILKELL